VKGIIEWFKDPKNGLKRKSLIQLILWIIFIIIVFIIMNAQQGNNKVDSYEDFIEKEKTDEKYDDDLVVKNYEFEIKTPDTVIEGTFFDDYFEIIDEYDKYILKENIWYVDGEEIDNPLELNIEKFDYNSINNFLNTLEPFSNKSYEDGSFNKTYNISLTEFNTYYSDPNILSDESIINIEIEAKKDYINLIKIDLSNYYRYEYVIEITYDNINNIKYVN